MKKQYRIIISILFFWFISANAQNVDVQKNLERQLFLRARSYEQVGKYDLALNIYRELWIKSRTNINYYRGVYNNLVRLGRLEEAEQTVKLMLENVSSHLVLADLGDVYYKMGRKEDALAAWKKIINTNPESQSAYQIVASAMQRNSLFNEAIEAYRLGQKNLKNNKLFLIDIARLYRSQMDYLKAAQQYLLYLEAFPGQYSFVESNIISLVSNSDYAQKVVEILQQRVQKNPKNVPLKQLLAASYFRLSQYKKALDTYLEIDDLISSQKNSANKRLGYEIYQFAQNAYNDEEYEFALQGYQLLLQRYPKSNYSSTAELAIGKCLRNLGRYDEAVDYYQNLAKSTKRSAIKKNSLFQLGEIYLYHFHNPIQAEEFFYQILRIKPENSLDKLALFRIGECYIQKGSLKEARDWYKRLKFKRELSFEDLIRAKFMAAKISFWLGEFETAKKNLQEIITEKYIVPEKETGIFVNDALELSMLIDEIKNREILKKFSFAQLKKESGEPEQAEKIFQEILTDEKSNGIKDRILVELGDIHIQLRKYASAISDFQRILEEHPESIFADYAQKRIGDAYQEGLKNTKAAMEAYELVLTNFPDSIYLEEVRKKIRLLEKKEMN